MKRSLFSALSLGVFFLGVLCGSGANAQVKTKISGQVVDMESGESLPGVTILVKGTREGTVSDIEGNYSLAAGKADVLSFSFVGYSTLEAEVGDKIRLDVALEMDQQQLDEVVVVGYGEQKKANLTGAISTVDPKQIEDIPVGNLGLSLIGKLAGVQVNRNGTGIPGTGTPLVIRDESASGTERQVLYVIDGFIYAKEQDGTGPSGHEIFNRLDPSEIESITVLKDAAAAVYGARGAGGVVLVKTKRGSSGKPKINYSGSVGVGQATQIPKMLSAYDHGVMINEINDILGARQTQYISQSTLEAFKARDFDWVDGMYQNGVTNRHAFNVSGGNDVVRYFVGSSYYTETGNFDNLWYKKYGIRSNLETDITKDLKFSLNMNYSQGKNKKPYYAEDSQPGVLRDWYGRLLTAPRWIPPTVDGYPVAINGSWNPYALMQSNNFSSGGSDNTNISGRLDYSLPYIKGLKFNVQYSYNLNTDFGNRFAQDYEVYNLKVESNTDLPSLEIDENSPATTIGNRESITESTSKGRNYQMNAGMNYNKTLGAHNVSAMLVYEQTEGASRGFDVIKYGSEVAGVNQLWAFSNTGALINGSAVESGRYGVIGRLNYDYMGKYLIESTFRYEASQKFHPDYAKGFFPAVAIGWALSEERFIKDNVNFINFLKLRASAGRVGNDNVRPFEWKPSYEGNQTGPVFGTGDGTQSNAIIARNQGLSVPTRTWSKTNSYNLGMDITTLNHRLSLTTEYYYTYIFDGFVSRSNVPYVVGAEKLPNENYKISFSQGAEFQLGYKDKIGKDFQYSTNAVFSWRHSRPLRLYQNPAVIGTWVDELLNDDSNQPGYIALGVIRTDEDLEKVKAMYPDINGQPIEKGMIYYKDVGGPDYSREPDGILDGNDRAIIAKYTTPPYSYGLSFGVSYKSIRLSGTFDGAFGHKVFIQKDETVSPTKNTNVFAWWGDYWSEENPDASLPRPANYGLDGQTSTFWMRDGHTLRLNNLSLSYSVPAELSEKFKIPKVRVYSTVTNVWTVISPFDYKDPAVSRAYDYPLVRTINFGLSVSL